MGLTASIGSVARYRVNGKIKEPVMESIRNGLVKHRISDIDNGPMEKIVGWASVENPYDTEFKPDVFTIGPYVAFSMRIDKKNISPRLIAKRVHQEVKRKLDVEKRAFLSRNEKKMIKDHVTGILYLNTPATPSVYDLLWHVEKQYLWFFSTLKAANEELEAMFKKSFYLDLFRLFPFTTANLTMNLSDSQKDLLLKLSPTPLIGPNP